MLVRAETHTSYVINSCFITSYFTGLFKLQLMSRKKLAKGDHFSADYIFPIQSYTTYKM